VEFVKGSFNDRLLPFEGVFNFENLENKFQTVWDFDDCLKN